MYIVDYLKTLAKGVLSASLALSCRYLYDYITEDNIPFVRVIRLHTEISMLGSSVD